MRTDIEENWRSQAACRHADPVYFIPKGEYSVVLPEAVAKARLWCSGCRVFDQCLREGTTSLTINDEVVYAGMGPRDRRIAKRSGFSDWREVEQVEQKEQASRRSMAATERAALVRGDAAITDLYKIWTWEATEWGPVICRYRDWLEERGWALPIEEAEERAIHLVRSYLRRQIGAGTLADFDRRVKAR
jgi:hypothetical protein